MNKKRKGLLTAASILTIISASFAMIGAIVLLISSSFVTEDFLIDLYKADPTATFVEEADGGYKIFVEDENGEILTIDDETLVVVVKVLNVAGIGIGLVLTAVAIAKLVLAIKVLNGANKYKYKKGCTIALLVLSAITNATVELILIIIALCLKDSNKTIESENLTSKQEDVVLKNLNE